MLETCKLTACPTSVNVSTGRRLRSACERWSGSLGIDRRLVHWDQQHYSLTREAWSTTTLEVVKNYYAAGCIARPPLCTCYSDLSEDCVTSCASHWHMYVNTNVTDNGQAFHLDRWP